MRRQDPGQDVKTILVMVLAILVPALLTMATVTAPPIPPQDNPTPYGYTVSLLLFLVPVGVVAWWYRGFRRRNSARCHDLDLRAMWVSAAIMAFVGVFLDLVFGYTFFRFPNPEATLGIRLPSWDFAAMAIQWDYLPVEEFAFYGLGAFFMVGVYIWADMDWLSDYDPDEYADAASRRPKLFEFSPHVLGLWAAILGAGIGYALFLGSGNFPGYFTFLMVLGFLPSVVMYRTVKKFVNWRAFFFAFGMLVFISIIWEATLGVPYGWWVYKMDAMLGFTFHAWANLPVEAVLLWLVGCWDAIMLYELVRVYYHMPDERSAKHRLFGER